jgi:hypothetical protein
MTKNEYISYKPSELQDSKVKALELKRDEILDNG